MSIFWWIVIIYCAINFIVFLIALTINRIRAYNFRHSGFKKGDIITVDDKKFPINNGTYKIKNVKKNLITL